MEGKVEGVFRIYDSLKNFLGENKVFKCGDILYVSTKDNGYYDTILRADGHSSFRELWQQGDDNDYCYVMVKKD